MNYELEKSPTSEDFCPSFKSSRVYFNKPQRLTQLIGANISVIVAGRRTGKTDSIAAPFVLRNMQRMPGSTGGIVVPTFKHGLTNTLPGLFAAWKRWGFIRGVHYVIGRKPPKTFQKPITEPADYEHIITFYNGSTAVIISQDRPGSSNSLTLSWLLIDEAKFIDYQKLKDETLPANGGIKTFFGKHSYNHAIMILSDMPQTQKGSWFLHYKDKMDTEVIKAIEALVLDIWKLKERIRTIKQKYKLEESSDSEAPSPWADRRESAPYNRGIEGAQRAGKGEEVKSLLYQLHHKDKQLNQLRSVAVYYKEYSSIENLQLLGENYIRQMKRDLTPLTFQTSILCQRIGIAKDGFYSSMREAHKYDADNLEELDRIAQEWYQKGDNYELCTMNYELNSRLDLDCNPNQPLCIGMDYNANINWIVAGQPSGRRLNILKSFYVKFERKLPALVDDFCTYYSNHQNKTVIFYYDTTALGSNYAVNDQDFRWVIIHEFERHGWTVNDVYLGNPMHHDEKYLLINQGFAGKQHLMPFFNRQNNEDLILAIQAAGVTRGRNGFHKDKGGEKLAESEEDLLEHRTDGTDAFDTLYIGCEKFPQSDTPFCSFSADGVL